MTVKKRVVDRKTARRIVHTIMRDIFDRRGLRQAMQGVDDDVRAEITETWVDIVVRGGDASQPEENE